MSEMTPEAMELLRQTHDAIIRCEEKLDLKADRVDLEKTADKLDRVEDKLHWYSGGVAALAAVLHLTARQ